MLKVHEVFWSFQGEGVRTGCPSVFLRLAGCSLGCPYCDTKEAWNDSGKLRDENEVISEVSELINKYPGSDLVITGGEPYEQDFSSVLNHFSGKEIFTSVETNGLRTADYHPDWITVSPKDVADYSIHPDMAKRACEIKLIANNNLTLNVIKRVREMCPDIPLFLQPDSTLDNSYERAFNLFIQSSEAGVDHIRAGVQLHTIYRVD